MDKVCRHQRVILILFFILYKDNLYRRCKNVIIYAKNGGHLKFFYLKCLKKHPFYKILRKIIYLKNPITKLTILTERLMGRNEEREYFLRLRLDCASQLVICYRLVTLLI